MQLEWGVLCLGEFGFKVSELVWIWRLLLKEGVTNTLVLPINKINCLNTFTTETSSPNVKPFNKVNLPKVGSNATLPRAQKSPLSTCTNRGLALVRQRHQPGRRPGQRTGRTGLPYLVRQRARVRTLLVYRLKRFRVPLWFMWERRARIITHFCFLVLQNRLSPCLILHSPNPPPTLLLLWGSSTQERPFIMPRILPRPCVYNAFRNSTWT